MAGCAWPPAPTRRRTATAATERREQDEVVLCLSGRGEVHIDGAVHSFTGGDTVVLPRDSMHQIFNAGDQPLEIVGVFGGSPVSTYLADGCALPLPWRT
jgi:mannose-6-phosphate isomerase-like protein (cupin superfamily)